MQAVRRDTIRLAVALALALGLFTLAAKAQGDGTEPVPITTGSADWGLKESFRNYIVGSIAHGSIAVGGGASVNPDGTFHFPLLAGSYDPDSKSTFAHFAGSVHFSGHDGELDMTLDDLAVEVTPEGADVFADVASKSLSDGALVGYPNVNLADLDVSGVTPATVADVTGWAAIPAKLTAAGVPAFANFYTAGQALDPFSFSYEGPGGKPTPEAWTPPGTPGYEQIAAEATANGSWVMYVDRARGLLHVSSGAAVRALDLQTLAQKGSKTPAAGMAQGNYAFDPVHATVFAVPSGTAVAPIRAFTWNETTNTYDEAALPISGTKTTQLAYDPSKEKLYAIEGNSALATISTSTFSPAVGVAVREGSGWTAQTYAPLASGGRAVNGLVRTSEGRLVASLSASYIGTLAPANIYSNPALELTDTGSALTTTEIPATAAPAPPSGFTFGYQQPLAGPNGTVTLSEIAPSAPTTHTITLTPTVGGFSVSPALDVSGGQIGAVDPSDGTAYALKAAVKSALVIKQGAIAATLNAVPQGATEFVPSRAAADEGVFYFHNNSVPVKVYALRHSADSPTIEQQPVDATAVLNAPATSTTVSFEAAASADPAPAVLWQVHKPGIPGWDEIAAETGSQLSVVATAAAAGNRYRAVFSNSAGKIASQFATLAVRVVPEKVPDKPVVADPKPPAATAGAPRGTMPKLKLAGGPRVVRSGVATVATIACPGSLPCLLRAPKKVRLKIAAESYWAKLMAPGSVMAGRSAKLKLKLPPAAQEALAGAEANGTFRLVVRSGEELLTRKLTVALRGAGKMER